MTTDERLLNDIAVMMSEFVDNWPNPKKVSTALALIAKTMRVALNERDLPLMRRAFRTTQSGGGKYEMVFTFTGMEAMHAADDEWHAFRDATEARARTASSTREGL